MAQMDKPDLIVQVPSARKKTRRVLQEGDEIVRYFRADDGKMKKLVKRIVKETV